MNYDVGHLRQRHPKKVTVKMKKIKLHPQSSHTFTNIMANAFFIRVAWQDLIRDNLEKKDSFIASI